MNINKSLLESVPKVVFANICRYLDLKDIRSLQLTNKAVNKLFNENICKFIYYLNHPSQDRNLIIKEGNNTYKELLNIDIEASLNIQQSKYKYQVFVDKDINNNERYIVMSTKEGILVFDMLLGTQKLLPQQGTSFKPDRITPNYLLTSHKDQKEQCIMTVWDLKTCENKGSVDCYSRDSMGISMCKQFIWFLDREEKLTIRHLETGMTENRLDLTHPVLKTTIQLYKNFLNFSILHNKLAQDSFFLWQEVPNTNATAMFIFNLKDKSSKNILLNCRENDFCSFFQSDNVLFFIPKFGVDLYRWDLKENTPLTPLNVDIDENKNILWHHHFLEEQLLLLQFKEEIKIINLQTNQIDRVLKHEELINRRTLMINRRTLIYHNRVIQCEKQGVRIWDLKTGDLLDHLKEIGNTLFHKIIGHYLCFDAPKDNLVHICDLRADRPLASRRKLSLIRPEGSQLCFIGMIQNSIVISSSASPAMIHMLNWETGLYKTIETSREPSNMANSICNNSIIIHGLIDGLSRRKLITEILHFAMPPLDEKISKVASSVHNNKN